jgi:hypothetical protein
MIPCPTLPDLIMSTGSPETIVALQTETLLLTSKSSKSGVFIASEHNDVSVKDHLITYLMT